MPGFQGQRRYWGGARHSTPTLPDPPSSLAKPREGKATSISPPLSRRVQKGETQLWQCEVEPCP